MDRDRNLLFGVLAVQLHYVNPQQLVEASAKWAVKQGESLGNILEDLGHISNENRELIEKLLDSQVKEHNGDINATFQSFGGERAVHETFAGSIVLEKDGGVSLVSFGGESEPTETGQQNIEDTEGLTIEHPGRYTFKGE